MRRTSLTHEFIESFPPELKEGVLYISMKYATAAHNCACGCGNKVVTPLKPAPVGWQLLFDGKAVSLTPSIGNWAFPCQSHYWIKSDKVRWAGAWTPEQIAAGRLREARDREQYFADRLAVDEAAEQAGTEVQPDGRARSRLLDRVLHWLGRF